MNEDERREHLLIVIDAGRQLTAEIDGVPRLEAVIDAALRLAVPHETTLALIERVDPVLSNHAEQLPPKN